MSTDLNRSSQQSYSSSTLSCMAHLSSHKPAPDDPLWAGTMVAFMITFPKSKPCSINSPRTASVQSLFSFTVFLIRPHPPLHLPGRRGSPSLHLHHRSTNSFRSSACRSTTRCGSSLAAERPVNLRQLCTGLAECYCKETRNWLSVRGSRATTCFSTIRRRESLKFHVDV